MEVIKSVSVQVFKSGNSTFWYSFVFVFIYPFGIPVLFTAMMFYFEVPKIAKVCIVIWTKLFESYLPSWKDSMHMESDFGVEFQIYN